MTNTPKEKALKAIIKVKAYTALTILINILCFNLHSPPTATVCTFHSPCNPPTNSMGECEGWGSVAVLSLQVASTFEHRLIFDKAMRQISEDTKV